MKKDMHMSILKYVLQLAVITCVLTSCNVIRPYQSPNLATSGLYRDHHDIDSTGLGQMSWKDLFTDSLLTDLISQGLENNLDLQMAYTRIQQAEAYFLQSRAAFMPLVNADLGITRSKLSEAQGFGIRTHATQYQLGLSAAWEADIWGKLRSSKRAAMASFLQSQAGAQAVQTGLVAGIANYYYVLMALDEQLAITEQTVMNWDTTVSIMRELKESAIVTEAAVVQSEAQRYVAEVTIPDLRQSIRETENALSILLGMPPEKIERGQLDQQEITDDLATGVPALLLANRPDVLQAELNLRYYFEMTNVARTYFYPALNVSGSAGFSALMLRDFINPASLAASIGASLTQPVLNRRINKTRLEVAEAQQQEALLNFRNTLLVAGQEVSDALSLHQTAIDKMQIRDNQLVALQKSVDYSQELLQNGFANYNEVITARQSMLQAELGSVNDQLQRFQAIINLYRALGGGR